ncbi:MAG TPA: DUF4010 domain-containing protein [Bacteroidota bacterium]|nr:DUF4010 domain-containing protein [Bacteroidota bacterium]
MGFSTIEWTIPLRFIVALALGFLVGLERESAKGERKLVFGGVRTHPIISMFGFGCAWLYSIGASFMLPMGLLAIALLTGINYFAKIRVEQFGSTSEVSALLTFITGALAMLVDIWIAMAMGIVNTILLSEKAKLESTVERLSKVEFLALIKFLLITLIIYPVLPNKEFTQFLINPARVWWIVIIVSSLGFVGYFLEKKFGERLGLWLSGLLGGIVSSTVVTLSVGRIARKFPARSADALQAALLASSVMYLRILVLIFIINPGFLSYLWYRLLILSAAGALISVQKKTKSSNASGELPELQNPFELRPALGFALFFVALSVITTIVKTTIGNAGLLGLAAIVGVTDIDPFLLSIIQNPGDSVQVGAIAILIAMASNTVAKGIYFYSYTTTNRKQVVLRYSLLTLCHIPLILF